MKVSVSEVLTIVNLIGIISMTTWAHAKAILPLKNKVIQLEKDNELLIGENKDNKEEINILKLQNSKLMIKIDHLTDLLQEIKQELKHDRR